MTKPIPRPITVDELLKAMVASERFTRTSAINAKDEIISKSIALGVESFMGYLLLSLSLETEFDRFEKTRTLLEDA